MKKKLSKEMKRCLEHWQEELSEVTRERILNIENVVNKENKQEHIAIYIIPYTKITTIESGYVDEIREYFKPSVLQVVFESYTINLYP